MNYLFYIVAILGPLSFVAFLVWACTRPRVIYHLSGEEPVYDPLIPAAPKNSHEQHWYSSSNMTVIYPENAPIEKILTEFENLKKANPAWNLDLEKRTIKKEETKSESK